jgi:hypothetical protein
VPSSAKVRENARAVCVARWYDPGTGEFLSVDPDFNETLDAYGYADENPLDGTDPSGLDTKGDCAAMGMRYVKGRCDLLPPPAPVPKKTTTNDTTTKLTTKQSEAVAALSAALAALVAQDLTLGRQVEEGDADNTKCNDGNEKACFDLVNSDLTDADNDRLAQGTATQAVEKAYMPALGRPRPTSLAA